MGTVRRSDRFPARQRCRSSFAARQPARRPHVGRRRCAAPATCIAMGPTRYNVPVSRAIRRAAERQRRRSRQQRAAPASPASVNAAPLDALTFSDPLTGLDGRRALLRGAGGARSRRRGGRRPRLRARVRRARSTTFRLSRRPACQRRSGEGEITLIWEPNAEPMSPVTWSCVAKRAMPH